jgi:hypothetical protein
MRILGGLDVPSRLEDCKRYVNECNIENLKAGKLDNAPFDVARMGKESSRISTTGNWRIELSAWPNSSRRASGGVIDVGIGIQTRGSQQGKVR